MTLDMDARIAAAMQRQAAREAQKQAEAEAAREAAWREACRKSEAYYAPLWDGDLTPDLAKLLGIGWVANDRNETPMRFRASLDGWTVYIRWGENRSMWPRETDTAIPGRWYFSDAYNAGVGIEPAERGQLADTLLAVLGQRRQERAEQEARQARERQEQARIRRENEEYCERVQREREAQQALQLAAARAAFQALVEEDAVARPLLEAEVERLRFHWPEGERLTVYHAEWCSGWTWDGDDSCPVSGRAWGRSDRPDAHGYYHFESEGKNIKPPRETLVWERYEVDGLETLPMGLYEPHLVTVPGFTTEHMYNPDGDQRSAEFVVRREGQRVECGAGRRPVAWIRAALGIPDPPTPPAEATATTTEEDDCPF